MKRALDSDDVWLDSQYQRRRAVQIEVHSLVSSLALTMITASVGVNSEIQRSKCIMKLKEESN